MFWPDFFVAKEPLVKSLRFSTILSLTVLIHRPEKGKTLRMVVKMVRMTRKQVGYKCVAIFLKLRLPFINTFLDSTFIVLFAGQQVSVTRRSMQDVGVPSSFPSLPL